jgi:hypothetical protein
VTYAAAIVNGHGNNASGAGWANYSFIAPVYVRYARVWLDGYAGGHMLYRGVHEFAFVSLPVSAVANLTTRLHASCLHLLPCP